MSGNNSSKDSMRSEGKSRLWRNARLATLKEGRPGLGIVENGAILSRDGDIVFAGSESDVPEIGDAETIDLGGRWVTPGLVDCHTHIVHGGNRAREFEMRLEGASYEEIARAGGGIVSSVNATRALSVNDLIATALPRLDTLLAEGVTTIEVKSGCGLSIESELKMLQAARALEDARPVRVVSLLSRGACDAGGVQGPQWRLHRGGRSARSGGGACKGLVDAVDGFCEGIAFFARRDRPCLRSGQVARHPPVKLHAEQLSNLSGAKLAASYGALPPTISNISMRMA